MPASFLHGVETVETVVGGVPIKLVKYATIGLIGTAPIQTVDAADRTVNEPVIILSTADAAAKFGTRTPGYTIPAALDAIFDQATSSGIGAVVVINVFDPARHVTAGQPDPSKVTPADLIGATQVSGDRTGMQAWRDCANLMGFRPYILIAPGFSTTNAVAAELLVLAQALRGQAVLDVPVGTTPQQVLAGRGPAGTLNLNYGSARLAAVYPHVTVYDTAAEAEVLEPLSPRFAGVWSAQVMKNGYWFSPSNWEIAGITGLERRLTAGINDPTTEVNLLNEAGVITVFNSYGTGLRTWGNRSLAWPTDTSPQNFLASRLVADVIEESIELAMLQFIDRPITLAWVDAVLQTVNAFLRDQDATGAIIAGKAWFPAERNSAQQLAAGHPTFAYSFLPPPPAERITFLAQLDLELLRGLTANSQ